MRKEKLTYYFSVEGETEKWYLDWLQDRINERPANKSQVEISDLGGSGKKTTQNQAAEHLKIETAASQMV